MATVIKTTRRSNQVFSSLGNRYRFPLGKNAVTVSIDSVPGTTYDIFPECTYTLTTCKIQIKTPIIFTSNANVSSFVVGSIDPIFRPATQTKDLRIIMSIAGAIQTVNGFISPDGKITIIAPITSGQAITIQRQTLFYGVDFF